MLFPGIFLLIFLLKGREIKNILKPAAFSILGYLIGQPHLIFPSNLIHLISAKNKMVFNDTGMNQSVNYDWWMDNSLKTFYWIRDFLLH